MTRALVVGGAGFIGSNLAESLLGHGYHVRIFDRVGARSPLPDEMRMRWNGWKLILPTPLLLIELS